MLPIINPKKKEPLIKPHHSSLTCSASLTNTYKMAAIQTVPAMVSNISIIAIFLKIGVDNKSSQTFLRKHNKILDNINKRLTIQTISCGLVITKNKLPTNHITV